MVPPKTDNRWIQLVNSSEDPKLTTLAAKMLLMRVRMMTQLDKSSDSVERAVNIAYDFFAKNESALKEDIEAVFGKDTK